jgi:hypothetical protein
MPARRISGASLEIIPEWFPTLSLPAVCELVYLAGTWPKRGALAAPSCSAVAADDPHSVVVLHLGKSPCYGSWMSMVEALRFSLALCIPEKHL